MGNEGGGGTGLEGGGGGLKESCPQRPESGHPGFRQWPGVAVQAQATGWDGGGEGWTACLRPSLPPRQLSAQSWLSRGHGLDKGSAVVPAGARGLCIQVLAPRPKAHWHVLVRASANRLPAAPLL